MLTIRPPQENPEAIKFCKAFVGDSARPRYVLGRNDYARSIGEVVALDGYIDDFTEKKSYAGLPVVKSEAIRKDSLVVTALFAKPLTVHRRLSQSGIDNLDYFAFFKCAGLGIKTPFYPVFQDFINDIAVHRNKYESTYALLADEVSRHTFNSLINFRLSSDLSFMQQFTDRQLQQYFEAFLELRLKGETFVDVGGFNGLTTAEFIRRCPNFHAVHFFEPIAGNMTKARQLLAAHSNVHYYPTGLSDSKQRMFFSADDSGDGSASRASKEGNVEIQVDALDNLVQEPVTFIKMDIEGGECAALAGCSNIIQKYHPRLAISAYHRHDDFWKIPEQVHSCREDYKLYLRHYTEGTLETVMFFIPQGSCGT